jgi:hypothetical protein
MDGDIISAIVEDDKEFSHSLALHLTGAAILVSRDIKRLAGGPGR